MAVLLVLAAVVVVVGVLLALTYNGLVTLRNRVDNAWSQVDVQLQRRHDLVPNLVETVRGYATHERTVLDEVTQARAAAISARGVADQAAAEQTLTTALRSVFAVAEAYPELRASAGFVSLQDELAGTEEKIAYARQFFNDTVQRYNTRVQTFPTLVVAGPLGFREREYFESDDASRGPVKVQF